MDELLNNRKREDVVRTLIKIDRVKGMIETIALRKKFLKHLETKKQQAANNRNNSHNCKRIFFLFLTYGLLGYNYLLFAKIFIFII